MRARFVELDWSRTPLGEIVLRRRHDPVVDLDIYEVKLADEFLMSSLFTVAEVELSYKALAALPDRELSILVGGLGLGYTARAALDDSRVSSLAVVEAIESVIDWHRRGLLPDTAGIADDTRCSLLHDDFFELLEVGPGSDSYDAILLDIDHSPRHVLNPRHTGFYTPDGLRSLVPWLTSDGVFALWSDDPPDSEFEADLDRVFIERATHVVTFPNPFTGDTSANTVYVACRPR